MQKVQFGYTGKDCGSIDVVNEFINNAIDSFLTVDAQNYGTVTRYKYYGVLLR